MKTRWIAAIWVLSTAGLVLAITDAAAQSYPSKPITYIVPYGPGGGNDVIARILAQKIGETWSQPLVLENRPGAMGGIGMEMTAKAARCNSWEKCSSLHAESTS